MATEKETTAPIPSVAPDGEQPSALARTNSIVDSATVHKQFGKIQAVTMPELMETRFRVRPAVIDGLIERLTDFWSEHTDTVLIIIDTLQRVRGRTPDNGSYAADYDTLAGLKEFSDTYGVTVLVVHHTRKEGAEDVFNTISGTNGLMGVADSALILYKDRRMDSDAVLEAVGRDQQQLRLHLSFDAAHLR